MMDMAMAPGMAMMDMAPSMGMGMGPMMAMAPGPSSSKKMVAPRLTHVSCRFTYPPHPNRQTLPVYLLCLDAWLGLLLCSNKVVRLMY